jgi:hypothetical protein
LGSGKQTPSLLAICSFEAELLKQDAGPACGSRLSLGYASRRSFDPVEPQFHRLSFRQATLGLGQLVKLFHSSLSF